MKLKAVIPGERAREVSGVPVDLLRKAVAQVGEVRWFNGSDFLETLSSKEVMRRLNAMPDGCEVVVMGSSSRSKRQFPCPTGFEREGNSHVTINTHFEC